MCNVDGNNPSDTNPIPRNNSGLTGSKCVKCDEPGVLITRIHDAFCKSCFQVYVVHKFRSAIGKSKLIRDGETVLVAFSGGANSAALLHLIEDGLSYRAHKRLRFTPVLLHIDENGLLGSESPESKKRQELVQQIMLKSGFPSYWTHLELGLNVIGQGNGQVSTCQENESIPGRLHLSRVDGETQAPLLELSPQVTMQLHSLIGKVENSTAQEDIVYNLKKQILVLAARQLGFRKILTAETSTRLAVLILSDVAQGRGAQVALDTGISDERNTNVMFMRPVRDLNAKELAMYNNIFGVESVFTATLTTKHGLASSIERLTETFVTGLQAEFPSTVSNIVRTSEKLGLPDTRNREKCSFCQSPLDTDVGKASALGAVMFSQQMSRKANSPSSSKAHDTDQKPISDELNGNCDPSIYHQEEPLGHNLAVIYEFLCYGCRLSLDAFNGKMESLPSMITKTASLKIRKKQKEHLSEYLLEEDDFHTSKKT